MRTSESSWSSNAPQPPGLPAPRARAAGAAWWARQRRDSASFASFNPNY